MTKIFCFRVNNVVCFDAKFKGSKQVWRYSIENYNLEDDVIFVYSLYRLGKIKISTGEITLTKAHPNGAKPIHFETDDCLIEIIENFSELLEFIRNPDKSTDYIPVKSAEELLLEAIFGY